MAALIRCVLRLNMQELEAMTEDEFIQAWCQVKFYLQVTHSVKFE